VFAEYLGISFNALSVEAHTWGDVRRCGAKFRLGILHGKGKHPRGKLWETGFTGARTRTGVQFRSRLGGTVCGVIFNGAPKCEKSKPQQSVREGVRGTRSLGIMKWGVH